MPSASTTKKSVVAPDVKCSGCGNPIIKDGQFKCLRCRPHRLVQATLDKQDIVCSRHRSAVVLMRYSQRDGYRVYCQKSGCHNHDAKVGTPILTGEEGMTQAATEQETQTASKTQELRDWLANEIRTAESDILVLDTALRNKTKGVTSVRYDELTSDECEAKMKEDVRKLEQLKQRLELLKSAQELDVDVDALENALICWWSDEPFWKTRVTYPYLNISRDMLRMPSISVHSHADSTAFSISPASRVFTILTKGDSLHEFSDRRAEGLFNLSGLREIKISKGTRPAYPGAPYADGSITLTFPYCQVRIDSGMNIKMSA